MSEEKLTAEEAAAMEAMETGQPLETSEADEASNQMVEAEPEQEAAPEPEQEQEQEQEPVFKSQRAPEQPDWNSLTPEQRTAVARVLEGKPPEGMVPHAAMHSERQRRQELERRIAEQQAQAEQPAAPEYVDPLVDPEGFKRYQDYQIQQVQRQNEALQRNIARQNAMQARVQKAAQYEAEFAAKTPDYNEAVAFLQESREAELSAAGYGADEIARQIQADAHGIFEGAERMNMNPAEIAYMQAKARGFAPKQPVTETPQAAPSQPTEAEKVAALATAQEATAGIATGGAPQEGKLTIKALAEMSEAELAKLDPAEFERVMGG